MKKSDGLLVLICALLIGAATLVAAPVLTRKPAFLAVLPFAAVIFFFMVLNIQTMFTLIISTRSLMDPFFNMTKLGESGGGIGGVLNLFVILMVVLVILRGYERLKGNGHVVRWGIFLAIALLTVVISPLRGQAVKLFLNLTTYACMFAIPFFLVRSQEDKRFWIRLMLLTSLLPVGAATLGLAVKHPILYSFGRLQGTFTHANILAFYLVFVLTLCLAVLRTRVLLVSPMKRALLWLYIADIFLLLVITETRSAWFSCVAMFLIYGLLGDRKLFLTGILVGAVLFFAPPVQERLKSLSEGTGVRSTEKLNSWTWRVRLWESAVPSIKRRILTGHGLGSFQHYSKSFFDMEKKKGAPAHNVFVELIFETGLFGLLSYLMIYLGILKFFFKRFRTQKGLAARESVLIFAYVFSYLMVCISDNVQYYLAFNWYFWFLLGVLISAAQAERESA